MIAYINSIQVLFHVIRLSHFIVQKRDGMNFNFVGSMRTLLFNHSPMKNGRRDYDIMNRKNMDVESYTLFKWMIFYTPFIEQSG